MGKVLNPYINFRGQAKEALDFYRSVFGGDVTASSFGEAGMPVAPGEEDQIMHGQLESPSGFTLMVSDVPSSMELTVGSNISVALAAEDEKELRGYWDKLADGADQSMPLEKAPWGDTFGMLTDKFGIHWMVNIAGSATG